MIGLIVVVAVLVLVASYPLALVSASRTPPEAYEPIGRRKESTIILIAVTGGIGGLYYWLRIRPELRAEGDAANQRAIERRGGAQPLP